MEAIENLQNEFIRCIKKGQCKMAEKQKINAQQLKNIIDSARKIMRKDKGLNGDFR